MGKKYHALITGATGNIGQACFDHIDNIVIAPWSVRGIARRGSDDTRIDALDLTRWNPIQYWASQQEAFDLVVMAHGVQVPMMVSRLAENDWRVVLENNLSAAVALTAALVQQKKLSKNALITFCSSIQAYTPRAGRGAYAAAKAGLEAFAKALAAELAPDLRVVVLRLGQLTATMRGVTFTETERTKLEARTLLPWVAPADIARLIWNLYEQPSVTGCIIDIDSGQGRNVW